MLSHMGANGNTREVVYRPTAQLASDPRNSRTHSKRHIRQAAKSVEIDGLYVDTIIRRWQRWTGPETRRGGAMRIKLGEIAKDEDPADEKRVAKEGCSSGRSATGI